ncbi:multi-sensor signal transduction histidine kinase [Halosimplex carlsbadense 2-9-1]|uniref:Multi-sensor signal transduction histidine kinase n=2 Tax=Halosimplex carlsbadense TaxID=171164 RepID=M0CAY5_9EURY|nr:multi-sensor signal transduction histidine kinase [Halosimplex carlsbadense 2-9-1]
MDSSSIDVLLVDDSGFFRTIVSDRLGEAENVSVWKAEDGEEALETLADRSVDCVVSDFEMPGLNGLELYERVHAEYGLPFILLTGQGDERTASRAIGAGVDDYLRKDDIAEEGQLQLLANRIENVVAQRRANEKYELLVNNTPDEITQVAVDGTITAANEAAARSFDTTRSELTGTHLSDVLPKETAASRIEHGRRALTAGSAVTFQDTFGVRHFHNVAAPVSVGSEANSFQLITRDITEQKRRERELETRTEELAVINRLVRHDINNDIQLLLAWADGIDRFVDDEEGREYVERIQNTCDHIDELTTIARDFVDSIGSDAEFSLTGIDLRQILDDEIEKADRRHDNLSVTVERPIPSVAVRANELLSSVFGNLLSNAVRHNDSADPQVSVTVEVSTTEVTVRFADNGPGIPDGQKDSIFGKGEMGPESPGTGIGLYLAHTLVEQYGGEIEVVDGEPTGSVFTVTLPKHA